MCPSPALSPDLIACPVCDTLYTKRQPAPDQRAYCGTCGHVLVAPREKAGMQIIMLSLAVIILVMSALFFPFLDVSAAGITNKASLIDIIISFDTPGLFALAFVVAALIVVLPVLRMLLLIYVIAPLVFDAPPWPGAPYAFRWASVLKPWAMAEIFVLGVAVALVKVVDLAEVGFGAAFWMFSALVVISLLNDAYLCTNSVWRALEQATCR